MVEFFWELNWIKFTPTLFPFLLYSFLFFPLSFLFITSTLKFLEMIKILATIGNLSLLLIISLILYLFHKFTHDNYFSHVAVPILSIHFFNFFSLLIFLTLFRININQKYFRPIVVFISLTLIKMLFVVIYFILMINYNGFEATNFVYNFFPVYFFFLVVEVLLLKKWLNNL